MISRISFLSCLLTLTSILTACVADHPPAAPAHPGERPTYLSMVISVSDGDTLSAVVNGIPEKIRLTGIDCPEGDQPFGREATQMAKHLALENASVAGYDCAGQPMEVKRRIDYTRLQPPPLDDEVVLSVE